MSQPEPESSTRPPKVLRVGPQQVTIVGLRLPFLDVVNLVVMFWVASLIIGVVIGGLVGIAAMVLFMFMR